MKRLIVSVVMLIGVIGAWTGPIQAQSEEVVWVQVEAQPSLAQARDRAQDFAATLPDVNGFSLGGGWYAIALGPYQPDDAQEVLRVYRSEGQIPRDSYIAESSSFRRQFWPVGTNLLNLPAPAPAPVTQTDPQVNSEQAEGTTEDNVTLVEPQVIVPDETPSEARASERALTKAEREQLQIALQWAGYYQAAIDGAFGRGTRRSMADWQEANNHEVTGILTTAQRTELIGQYNAILDGLGLDVVTDQAAGIEMVMPTDVVSFSRYSPPFAHYDSSGDIDARVLLISQEGNQNTLYGLYDIMQTLEIVPEDGPRERGSDSFTLVGEGATSISHSEAWLEEGQIKGFTLIWPAGDEERRRRLLGEMRASFTRLEGALDPAAGDDSPNIDLVSGLEIRRPKIARSGFFFDDVGHVVTTSEAVRSCGRITLGSQTEADVLTNDTEAGVAILKARKTLAPPEIARLSARVPRLQSEVAVAGFSYEGMLGAPTLTYGHLADIKGLSGETGLKRLALNALPGDAGGPVFDDSGAVLGMLLPDPGGDRQLPDKVRFAVNSETIRTVAQAAGLSAEEATGRAGRIAPEDLANEAQGLTVLVSCWD